MSKRLNPLPTDGSDPIVEVMPPPEMPRQVLAPDGCELHVERRHLVSKPRTEVLASIYGEKGRTLWHAWIGVDAIIKGVTYDSEGVPSIQFDNAKPVQMNRGHWRVK